MTRSFITWFLLLTVATCAAAQNGLIIPTAAYYGSDVRGCDPTATVNDRCGGLVSCSITANNQLCGDPDPGVVKALTVVYQCSMTGEDRFADATEGQAALLACDSLTIQAAVYGTNSDFCDATTSFVNVCENDASCSVQVSNGLCGDPAPGVPKDVMISYKCGLEQRFTTVGEGQNASLTCP